MLLSAELEASECQDSPEKFKERLIDGIVVQFPGQTIDGLLCSPLNALANLGIRLPQALRTITFFYSFLERPVEHFPAY